ncbi:MAG: HRDC domain-containing protein [Candidatus Omnitrophica bacterium]|nr:HRDC domain-containing protein [Candidatus Omnitrophota bacterium]
MNQLECAKFEYIDSRRPLDRLCEILVQADRIALDTEADSLHHYYAKVCLIQLTFGDKNYIVDPLSGVDLSAFLRILSSKSLIIHGADYDLRMLRSTFGFRPGGEIDDTMIAAQLAGFDEFGLSALVQRFFDVSLANLGKKTDWSKRPLSHAQLQYACEDTYYLLPLAERLKNLLQGKNRMDWLRECGDRVVAATAIDKPRDLEKVWRIKGVRFLDRRQLAYLREIWHWRENEAQLADLPPFKILGNQKMLDIVMWMTRHPDRPLREGPSLPRNCVGSRFVYLEKAIRKAQKLPEAEWPSLKKPQRPAAPAPNCKTLINALMNESARIAESLGIAPSVLATRSALTSIAHHRPQTLHDMAACSSLLLWQAKLLYPSIQRILNEESGEAS